METKFCECGCGTEIPLISFLGTERKFAHGHNRKNKEEYRCDNCGKSMYILGYQKWRKHHFCSFKCTGEYKRNKVSKICPNCEKEFFVTKARERTGKYCSKSCMSAFTKCFSKNRPCNYCGKTIKEDRRIKQERVYCNRECQHKWLSENFSGENNPQWIDGNKERYRGENWYRSRRTVIKRDDGKCRLCGSSFTICVHHITPIREYQVPEDANNLENLVCLCKSCHQKTEPRQGKINMLNERLRNENFAIYHW